MTYAFILVVSYEGQPMWTSIQDLAKKELCMSTNSFCVYCDTVKYSGN